MMHVTVTSNGALTMKSLFVIVAMFFTPVAFSQNTAEIMTPEWKDNFCVTTTEHAQKLLIGAALQKDCSKAYFNGWFDKLSASVPYPSWVGFITNQSHKVCVIPKGKIEPDSKALQQIEDASVKVAIACAKNMNHLINRFGDDLRMNEMLKAAGK
jgi:hypothetical protein